MEKSCQNAWPIHRSNGFVRTLFVMWTFMKAGHCMIRLERKAVQVVYLASWLIIYKEIMKELKLGINILFSGTP